MSFLSKLFRGNDHPPVDQLPADADGEQTADAADPAAEAETEAPSATADPAAETEAPSATAAEHAAVDDAAAPASDATSTAEQAQDGLPWWEEAATEPADQIAGEQPLAPGADAAKPGEQPPQTPSADAAKPAEDIQPAQPAGDSSDTGAIADAPIEEDGTRPLTEADIPALAAIRSRRGLAAAAMRDIGRIRSINQDSVFALITTLPRESSDVTIGLFVVADGMGGHDGGEVASRIAVTTVARNVLAELVLPALADNVTEALQPLIIAAVQDANRAIWEHAQAVGSDMGTTCTVALLLGHALYIGHVGDSRAYLATPTGMRLLTNDHSAVGRLIQVGQLDPSEARDHPMRSQLYRTVGQHPEVQVDFMYYPLGDATHLLLCSDGLWGMVDDEILLDVLEHALWPQDACRELIARANLAGGDDNISAVVVTLPAH